jgi:hypothetical protein
MTETTTTDPDDYRDLAMTALPLTDIHGPIAGTLADYGAAPSPAPAAPSVAQWMPIETAPKDGTPVLIWGATLCVPGEMVVGIRSDEHDDLELWDIHDGKHGPHRLRGPSPTHWMPLPASPGAQPAHGGSVSEAATVAMVIPYTDEDDRPDMDEWRMISIGRPGDIPDHVLDRIPEKAARILCDAINAAAPPAPSASPAASTEALTETAKRIDEIVQSVSEWDDRTSPVYMPEALLITPDELTKLLHDFAGDISAARASAPEVVGRLSALGLCWDAEYFPTLDPDEEFDIAPENHYRVNIITSLEDTATGWGATFSEAADAALRSAGEGR